MSDKKESKLTRQEQKEERRKLILATALELFVNRGYAATKITDIAQAANMSTGLLFHYFESKEALYEELVKIGLQGTQMPLQPNYPHAIDFFSEFTKGLFTYLKADPIMAKMFTLMAQTIRNDSIPDHIRSIAQQVNTIDAFVSIVEWGQREGSIKEGDPRVISNAFWCSIQGIAENFACNPAVDLPDPEWIVDIIKKNN